MTAQRDRRRKGRGKMRTLIVYATKYGCAKKCAEILAGKLDGETVLHDLRSQPAPDPAPYERVVIGGSIYIGKIQKEVTRYCKDHLADLAKKRIGLFICGMAEGENAVKEMKDAFPPELAEMAAARENFGGEFIFGQMSFLHRMIVRKIAKADKDVSKIAVGRIEQFAKALQA
jgi:menaquinone-dependent protoporphyrinogen oxidase